MTRLGKIARLPRDLRDQLNRRLFDGEAGPRLLPWLNAQPEVKQILAADFDGRPINAQNLSDWRNGGFADWCRYQETLELAERLGEETGDFEETGGAGRLTDQLATAGALMLAGRLRAVGAMAEGREKERAVHETIRSLVRLRRSEREAESGKRAQARHDREIAQIDWDRAAVVAAEELQGQELLRRQAAEVRGYFKTVRQVQADHRELPAPVLAFFATETEFERQHGAAVELLKRYAQLRREGLSPGEDWLAPVKVDDRTDLERYLDELAENRARHEAAVAAAVAAGLPPPVKPPTPLAPWLTVGLEPPVASNGARAAVSPVEPVASPLTQPTVVPAEPVALAAPVQAVASPQTPPTAVAEGAAQDPAKSAPVEWLEAVVHGVKCRYDPVSRRYYSLK